MIDFGPVFWALLGGFVPALIWLWFWLKEDFNHPEPVRLIIAAFLGGMLVVPFALVLEKTAHAYTQSVFLLFIIWAAIEEILKFGAAYFIAFRKECIDKSRCINDTMDPIIYLITVALGFSAVESTLFLINPLLEGDLWGGLVTGNLRFIGATVLHAVSSGIIGVAMGLSFYKNPAYKKLFIGLGICTAIVLHALFNISIISSKEGSLFIIFGILWMVVFALLAVFERVKRIRKTNRIKGFP